MDDFANFEETIQKEIIEEAKKAAPPIKKGSWWSCLHVIK